MTTAMRSSEQQQVRISAVWRVMPGALMVLGSSSSPLPKSGSARSASMPAALGVFRLQFWSRDGSFAFLAAIRLPERADPSGQVEILLRGARASDRDLPLRLVTPTSEVEFARQLSSMAERHAAGITRFLLDLLRPEDSGTAGSTSALLEHFVSRAAKPDGCIELILSIPGRCLVLQGWGTHSSESVDILTLHSPPGRETVQAGWFERGDVDAPATGCVLVLPPALTCTVAGAKTLYLIANDELLSRNVIDSAPKESDESSGQLRHLLPRLQGGAAMRLALRSALQPQFDGRDTLNSPERRVRAALDLALAADGAGIYLSGWLFDPDHRVSCVEVCTETVAARIDDRFVRVPRPDVSEAFQSLGGSRGEDWGFAAESAIPWRGDPAYLRFTLGEDDVAFLPLRVADARNAAARQVLLESVDLHKSSGLPVLEQHLAPFLTRLGGSASPARIFLEGPLERRHAIVVALGRAVMPRALVAGLLHDPADATEQIILICGENWDPSSLLRLRDAVRFYELPCSIVTVAGVATPQLALHAAGMLSSAEDFLLLSAEAASPHQGWRQVLRRRASTYDAICPTLLYEDGGIRFAGTATTRGLEQAPYIQVRVAQAGLPPSNQPANDRICPMTGGSLACALFRRSALTALDVASLFATPIVQEVAFFRALEQSGLKAGWLPMLQVVAPLADTQPLAASRLVDGWAFRAVFEEKRQCAS